jgi:hypothetical protein
MGHIRFRKSIKIAPGVRLNLNKKSTSVTFGSKGAHYTLNSKGTRTSSVGIPGTGLSYVDVKKKKTSSSLQNHPATGRTATKYPANKATAKPPVYQRNWFITLMLLFASPIGIFLMWYFKEWKTWIKIVISLFFIYYFMIYCGVVSTTM